MKLTYHEGKNFGDALNPFIFHHFLGADFFDNDTSTQFIGIGSILGLKKVPGKKIVFSSGYAAGDDSAYGTAPIINEEYEVLCVRGPKTASILKLSPDKAIVDGAVLLPTFYWPESKKKKYKCSLILHHKSLEFYSDWASVCELAGIHLIDAREDMLKVIAEIVASELILCEAMHGAIVADAYRIPWIPVNFYPHINFFKWQDWCESLEMKYNPTNFYYYLHDLDFFATVIKNKTKAPFFVAKIAARLLTNYRKKKNVAFLNAQKQKTGTLSNAIILASKQKALIEKLNELKSR
jgi:succinoglycan biosynthesis protein ExoV